MTYFFNTKFSLLGLSAIVGAALLPGCGGGGGSSTPSAPTPFDASYSATFTTSNPVPSDGKAPTGALVIDRGRGALQTTFYLQPSVVKSVQDAIDKGLRDNNVGNQIPNNQVPQNIVFNGSGNIDGNGKLVLTSKKSVSICGTATLTVDSNFVATGTAQSGTGNYQIDFPNDLTVNIRGRKISVKASPNGTPFTCNNLPLRVGTVAFSR